MKKTLLMAFAFSLLITGSAFAHCGTCGVGDPHPEVAEEKGSKKGFDKDKAMDHMNKKLGLSEEQSAAVQALMQEKKEKIKAIHEDFKKQMAEILTPEQMEQMDAMHKGMRDHMTDHKKDSKGSPKGIH